MRVADNATTCPLCHTVLTDFDGVQPAATYPDIDRYLRRVSILTKILIYLSIVAGVTSVIINWYVYEGYMWSVLTVTAILYIWYLIAYSIKRHSNLAGKVLTQSILASVLVVVADFAVGYSGWAVNYVVPILFSLANIAVLIIILVNRLEWHKYVIYQLYIAILGFVPIVLILFKIITEPFIPIISTVISGLTLIGIFVFGEKTVTNELKRRFHF